MDKISVIVPVYNVENYIDKCVESIVNQTYTNLEIILVDDGATDSSGKKCDEWAKKDARIAVIHKENGGLSDARNAGLNVATGEYIGFVDSDDWIDKEMYQSLYNVLKENGAKISVCQFIETTNEDEIVEKNEECRVFKGRELLQHMFEGKKDPYVTYSVWKFLYKSEVIGELKFPKGRLYEDVLFTTRAMWSEEKIPVCLRQMYYYRVRPESITKKRLLKKNVEDVFAYCDELLKFYKLNATDAEIAYLREAILWTILSFRYELKSGREDRRLAKELMEYLLKNNISKNDIVNKTLIKQIRYVLWFGPLCFCGFYRFASKLRE